MSIENFQSRVLHDIDGLSQETIGILVRLFRKVKRENSKRYIHGQYLQPAVAHGEVRDPSNPQKAKFATFINYPYFRLMPCESISKEDGSQDTRDFCRTILQTHYLLTSTQEIDDR